MEIQLVVNVLLGLAGTLLYMIYLDIKKDISKQDEILSEMAEKVHEIDKVVAGNYVLKTELNDIIKSIFDKLDKIYDKLDKKADK